MFFIFRSTGITLLLLRPSTINPGRSAISRHQPTRPRSEQESSSNVDKRNTVLLRLRPLTVTAKRRRRQQQALTPRFRIWRKEVALKRRMNRSNKPSRIPRKPPRRWRRFRLPQCRRLQFSRRRFRRRCPAVLLWRSMILRQLQQLGRRRRKISSWSLLSLEKRSRLGRLRSIWRWESKKFLAWGGREILRILVPFLSVSSMNYDDLINYYAFLNKRFYLGLGFKYLSFSSQEFFLRWFYNKTLKLLFKR